MGLGMFSISLFYYYYWTGDRTTLSGQARLHWTRSSKGEQQARGVK